MAEMREYFHLRPEVEKAFGYTHAVRIGDDIRISGAVSMDDECNPTAVDDLEQQMKNAYSDLAQVLKHYGAGGATAGPRSAVPTNVADSTPPAAKLATSAQISVTRMLTRATCERVAWIDMSAGKLMYDTLQTTGGRRPGTRVPRTPLPGLNSISTPDRIDSHAPPACCRNAAQSRIKYGSCFQCFAGTTVFEA
jgi:hypothetical protein